MKILKSEMRRSLVIKKNKSIDVELDPSQFSLDYPFNSANAKPYSKYLQDMKKCGEDCGPSTCPPAGGQVLHAVAQHPAPEGQAGRVWPGGWRLWPLRWPGGCAALPLLTTLFTLYIYRVVHQLSICPLFSPNVVITS